MYSEQRNLEVFLLSWAIGDSLNLGNRLWLGIYNEGAFQ